MILFILLLISPPARLDELTDFQKDLVFETINQSITEYNSDDVDKKKLWKDLCYKILYFYITHQLENYNIKEKSDLTVPNKMYLRSDILHKTDQLKKIFNLENRNEILHRHNRISIR